MQRLIKINIFLSFSYISLLTKCYKKSIDILIIQSGLENGKLELFLTILGI